MTTATTTTIEGTRIPAAGKYLTFVLSKECYGIAVLKIREIIRLIPITAVPQMPDFIKGVINLRGRIIPVVDLRAKFAMPTTTSENTCIIVVKLSTGAQAGLFMGLIVDSVEEVLNIAASDIEETPSFGTDVDTSYILGMAKIKGVVKTLLDIDRVVCGDDLNQLNRAAAG